MTCPHNACSDPKCPGYKEGLQIQARLAKMTPEQMRAEYESLSPAEKFQNEFGSEVQRIFNFQ